MRREPLHGPGAVLQDDAGRSFVLVHGDVVGRGWSAAVHLVDGRVSEAHAALSVRGTEVWLLGLRGRFKVNGVLCRETELRQGQCLTIAPGVHLTVGLVVRPEGGLAVGPIGSAGVMLQGVAGLFSEAPWVRAGWHATALGHVWSDPEGWTRDGPDGKHRVRDGATWSVNGTWFAARWVLRERVVTAQELTRPHIRVGSRLLRITHCGRETMIRGRSAQLVHELAVVGLPVDWHALARSLWGDDHRETLRRRWDTQLYRLRGQLIRAGVRPDLVVAHGTGLVELIGTDAESLQLEHLPH